MKRVSRASTGLPGLDDVIDGLRIGDNVVWQVDEIYDYMYFARLFVENARTEGRKIVYMRFSMHEEIFHPSDGIEIVNLNAEEGFESFSTQVHNIITDRGERTFYVFDSLSDLLDVWATDLMVGNFFMITCPYLFELKTVAYFAIQTNRHSFKTVARIRETTQVLLDAYRSNGESYIQPLKVWNRYSPTMFLPHHRQAENYEPVTRSIDAARLTSHISRRWKDTSGRNLDYWDRLFMDAEELVDHPEKTREIERMVDQISRIMITRDERMLALVKENFSLEDLLEIKARLIGTGYVGGKSTGMMLARKLLVNDKSTDWEAFFEPHDSFYIGSDVFYTYLVQNGWWKMRMEQKTPEGYFEIASYLREKMLDGVFPDEIQEQFIQVMEYFGQSPIIVRSSSLLEDSFGSAFAGKYESIFCANQGTPGRRYMQFEDAVRRIFSSCMNEDALIYRRQRGLETHDEQMALLVQRVSGSNRKQYFFPDVAGVGVSYNTFVWKENMDPGAGMLRLVVGLGTRAVDRVEGDYPRIVALDEPLVMPHAGIDDLRTFSQKDVDVINIEENRLCTESLGALVNEKVDMHMERVAVFDEDAARSMREIGKKNYEAWIVNFGDLLSSTDFVPKMQRMLKTLEARYEYPVDIEFTLNFTGEERFQINLLQCRPLQVIGHERNVDLPEVVDREKVFVEMKGNFMGGSISRKIDRIVYVDPKGYSSLDLSGKYGVARLIGELNGLVGDPEETAVMLMGPGRWGTTTPSLGVPVHFAEISNTSVLVEVADLGGNLMPELSFGTHFFQDLVETGIFFLAIFPWSEETHYSPEWLAFLDDRLEDMVPGSGVFRGVVKVFDVGESGLRLVADVVSQRLICLRD